MWLETRLRAVSFVGVLVIILTSADHTLSLTPCAGLEARVCQTRAWLLCHDTISRRDRRVISAGNFDALMERVPKPRDFIVLRELHVRASDKYIPMYLSARFAVCSTDVTGFGYNDVAILDEKLDGTRVDEQNLRVAAKAGATDLETVARATRDRRCLTRRVLGENRTMIVVIPLSPHVHCRETRCNFFATRFRRSAWEQLTPKSIPGWVARDVQQDQ